MPAIAPYRVDMAGPFRTTLIIASYNQTNALALVLEGVLRQELPPDEIVFADDGSEPDTLALVEAFRRRTVIPIVFTTQADLGFRKARALNNALRRARGEIVLFLDGDCIAPAGWATQFCAAIDRGADFATAGYVWMDLERTRACTAAAIAGGAIGGGITAAEQRQFDRVHRREQFYRLLRRRGKPRILGGNWVATRRALLAVNGFDENFAGFTKEDSDIRNRLQNAGFRGLSLWDINPVFHCNHALDPRRTAPGVWRKEPDYAYYQSVRGARRCARGLVDESSPEAGVPSSGG